MRVFFLCALLCAFSAFGQITTYVTENFTGSTAPGWQLTHTLGDGPRLTGGDLDPAGEGWLRLTEDKTNQNSFVYYTNSIPTAGGLVFTFDFVLYGRHGTDLADGFALVLFDSNVATPEAGAYGGALGYTQRHVDSTDTYGLAGGIWIRRWRRIRRDQLRWVRGRT